MRMGGSYSNNVNEDNCNDDLELSHPWLKSKVEIKDWLKKNDLNYQENKKKYKILDDSCSLDGEIEISNENPIKLIPVRFINVKRFLIRNNKLESLVGTPKNTELLDVSVNSLTSLDGLGANVEELLAGVNRIKSLKSKYPLNKVFLFKNPIESWKDCGEISEMVFWKKVEKMRDMELLFGAEGLDVKRIAIVANAKNKEVIDFIQKREVRVTSNNEVCFFIEQGDIIRLIEDYKSKLSKIDRLLYENVMKVKKIKM